VPPYSAPPAPGPPPPAPPGYGSNPYYAPPPPLPPRDIHRSGWNIGFSLGLGSMESSIAPFECRGCESDPPSSAFDVHIGSMVTPTLAIQFEGWLQSRNLDVDGM